MFNKELQNEVFYVFNLNTYILHHRIEEEIVYYIIFICMQIKHIFLYLFYLYYLTIRTEAQLHEHILIIIYIQQKNIY